jgi:hypothetical protein
MAKHVIFLVHGMGDFADGWSASIQKQMADSYAAYAIARHLPFKDFFQFEEITYNRRFDALRRRWRDDSAAVIALLKKGGLEKSAVNRLARASAAAGAEDEFLSTHVIDVLLYRFVPTVAEETRNVVARRILETLMAAPVFDQPRWSVIAHSLGTSVTHDALHALFTQGVQGQSLQGKTKAQLVTMVANVSRLLEERQVDVYKSVVRPSASPAEGACHQYLNVRHDWDPIPRPREFRPLDDWPDVLTRTEKRFEAVTINAFQNRNIHGFGHYLANPKVHVALFRRLLPIEGAISDAELATAAALHEASTPLGQFEALQRELRKFQIAEESSWAQVITAFQGFFNTVRNF